jgi:hypothetical protein
MSLTFEELKNVIISSITKLSSNELKISVTNDKNLIRVDFVDLDFTTDLKFPVKMTLKVDRRFNKSTQKVEEALYLIYYKDKHLTSRQIIKFSEYIQEIEDAENCLCSL